MPVRKFIVVLGSIMSGLGKGIVTSSMGKILQARNIKVVPIKFDGYLNVDCGTMNPYRHGEVFVLEDGTECDMDFGTYERFLNMDLESMNSLTGGKIFKHVIEKERVGGYLGYDVQIVPHLTDEIKEMVKKTGDKFGSEVVLIEVGGTVGDLENSYFIEAMRQLALEQKVVFVQLTYVPTMKATGEQKTKPTQNATKILQSMGIQPNIIICREDEKLSKESRRKISLFCNVPQEHIFDDPEMDTIYELPMIFEKQELGKILCNLLEIKSREPDLSNWEKLVRKIGTGKDLNIGITGKYATLRDSYVSIKEALVHAGAHLGVNPRLKWIDTTEYDEKFEPKDLQGIHGIIVPGGFGARGTEGKIKVINYARESRIPYLGLCLGMQLMVVEWARNVAGLKNANSTELDAKTPHPVIDFLPEQKAIEKKGATMRLGKWDARVKKGTRGSSAYGCEGISERHRHRYEVNPIHVETLEKSGLIICGTTPNGKIVEMSEWPDSFGVGTQAHPEFKSRLERPAPLFVEFLKACAKA